MTFLQRVLWLSRRNFLRGTVWNIGSIFLIAIVTLVFFAFVLFSIQPNPAFIEQYGSVLWLAEQLLVVILVGSFISLLVIFYLINRVRYHEIGVLRGIGAKRSFIFFMIVFEIQFLVLTGALLSVLIAVLLAVAGGDKLAGIFKIADGLLGWANILLSMFLSVVCASVASILAALYPALVISSIEPYNAIRNRE